MVGFGKVKYEYIVHRLSTDGSFFSAGRQSVNEPSKRMTHWHCSGDSRMKKVGALRGQGKKHGSQRKYLSYMVIFRCNEY